MTREEQNKNWSLLSEESKYHYQTEYKNRLEDAKREIEDLEGGGDLTVLTSQYIAKDIENLFGKHNLEPKPKEYWEIEEELFNHRANQWLSYYIIDWDKPHSTATHIVKSDCTSRKQAEKLLAINKLLNVCAWFNMKDDVAIEISAELTEKIDGVLSDREIELILSNDY